MDQHGFSDDLGEPHPTCQQVFLSTKIRLTRVNTGENRFGAGDLLAVLSPRNPESHRIFKELKGL
jgi:hypothetical protein